MRLDRVQVVLVRPDDPMNIGAVARAMKNCELSRLTLVAPRTDEWATARRVAVHAGDVLAGARTVATLAEAVEGAGWVVGTTSRAIEGRPALTPRRVATGAASLADECQVALVFGCEESGLSNDELLGCGALSSIPAGAEQPSYNLAQSVLLYAYELREAWRLGQWSAAPVAAEPARATDGELAMLEKALGGLLVASGFADPFRPRHGVRDLAGTLRRAGLSPGEARLWHAALRGAIRAVERGGKGSR